MPPELVLFVGLQGAGKSSCYRARFADSHVLVSKDRFPNNRNPARRQRQPEGYASQDQWKQAVAGSSVRLQWDPDHDPLGGKSERRAIQLGLRGNSLARYAREWVVRIEDVSLFVEQQRPHARPDAYERLLVPRERVYPVGDGEVAARLGVDCWDDKAGDS